MDVAIWHQHQVFPHYVFFSLVFTKVQNPRVKAEVRVWGTAD